MKKLILSLIFLTCITFSYSADFNLRLVDVYSDKAVIAIPRQRSGGTTFSIIVNGKSAFITNFLNSKIDANSVTTTVQFDSSNISTIYYISAVEINGPVPYASANLTITAIPVINQTMVDRDGFMYKGKLYFNSWRTNVASVGGNIVNTTFSNQINLTEIIVTGEVNGNVAVYINGSIVRRYSYNSNSTSGQIFTTKIPIPAGSIFKVVLENGSTGYHSVSISGEIVR